MPSRRQSSAMLSSPGSPSNTTRIFSSAEKCRRVARRMSLIASSAGCFSGPDFCLIFAPCGYDDPEILPTRKPPTVSKALTADTKNVGTYIQSVLNDLGYKASVKPISSNIQFTYIQNTNNKVQISISQWYQDYPAASDFLNVLLSCDSFHPGSDNSPNIPG